MEKAKDDVFAVLVTGIGAAISLVIIVWSLEHPAISVLCVIPFILAFVLCGLNVALGFGNFINGMILILRGERS